MRWLLAEPVAGLGEGEGRAYSVALYLNNQVLLFGVLGIIGSMPLWPWLQGRFSKLAAAPALGARVAASGWTLFEILWMALLMLASCASLATNTYNPFIYFRF